MSARRPPQSDPSDEHDAATPRGDDFDLTLDDGTTLSMPIDDEHADLFDLELGAEHRRFKLMRDLRSRLDVYLQQRLKSISRSKVQRLIEFGGVTVNGRKPKASTTLHINDVIDVILPPRAVRHIEPEPIPLEILYEDEHFIVVNKQADLIVHPARGNLSGTLLNALAHHFQQQRIDAQNKPRAEGEVAGLSNVGAADYRPGVIHRLDRYTTGVMVVAKSEEAHWFIARQFEDRTTIKAYLAVIHGCPDLPVGVIDQPLGKHPTIREAFAVRHDSAGKASVTIYRVRERYRGFSLVEMELKTGRTHQIRVHMSYTGNPLAGDLVYGGEPVGLRELETPPIAAGSRKYLNFARERAEGQKLEALAVKRDDLLITHPALHAAMLSFVHPITHERMTFTAPIHDKLAKLVHLLRRQSEEGPVSQHGNLIDLSQAIEPEQQS